MIKFNLIQVSQVALRLENLRNLNQLQEEKAMNEFGTLFCNACIEILQALSDASGISYGLLNVLFFVVLQPMAILSFMLSTAFGINYKSSHKIYKRLTITFAVLGLVCIWAVVIPLIYAFLFLPWSAI